MEPPQKSMCHAYYPVENPQKEFVSDTKMRDARYVYNALPYINDQSKEISLESSDGGDDEQDDDSSKEGTSSDDDELLPLTIFDVFQKDHPDPEFENPGVDPVWSKRVGTSIICLEQPKAKDEYR